MAHLRTRFVKKANSAKAEDAKPLVLPRCTSGQQGCQNNDLPATEWAIRPTLLKALNTDGGPFGIQSVNKNLPKVYNFSFNN